ncbi:hypothetical protein GQ457_03G025220 [Hibiscus cannabinus]
MEKFSSLSISTAFILLLILTIEMSPATVEGKRCETRSVKLKGLLCIIEGDCETYCKKEGFQGGKCKGFIGLCICTKSC